MLALLIFPMFISVKDLLSFVAYGEGGLSGHPCFLETLLTCPKMSFLINNVHLKRRLENDLFDHPHLLLDSTMVIKRLFVAHLLCILRLLPNMKEIILPSLLSISTYNWIKYNGLCFRKSINLFLGDIGSSFHFPLITWSCWPMTKLLSCKKRNKWSAMEIPSISVPAPSVRKEITKSFVDWNMLFSNNHDISLLHAIHQKSLESPCGNPIDGMK